MDENTLGSLGFLIGSVLAGYTLALITGMRSKKWPKQETLNEFLSSRLTATEKKLEKIQANQIEEIKNYVELKTKYVMLEKQFNDLNKRFVQVLEENKRLRDLLDG